MVKILIRRATVEEWDANNAIPQERELICVMDKDTIMGYKVGDGKTPYKELPFVDLISELDYINIYVPQGDKRVMAAQVVFNGYISNKVLNQWEDDENAITSN